MYIWLLLFHYNQWYVEPQRSCGHCFSISHHSWMSSHITFLFLHRFRKDTSVRPAQDAQESVFTQSLTVGEEIEIVCLSAFSRRCSVKLSLSLSLTEQIWDIWIVETLLWSRRLEQTAINLSAQLLRVRVSAAVAVCLSAVLLYIIHFRGSCTDALCAGVQTLDGSSPG